MKNYIFALYMMTIAVATIPAVCASDALPPVKSQAVQLTAPSAMIDFQSSLNALAANGHVGIVAEGEPLHPNLSSDEAAKLTAILPLDDEVNSIAAAYDYNAKREGNIFVLTKRYSDPNDLPALTASECAYALEQIYNVTEPYIPNIPAPSLIGPFNPHATGGQQHLTNPVTDAFTKSLSSEQLMLLQKGNLSVSTLSSSQREEIEQLLQTMFVTNQIDNITPALPSLTEAEKGAIFVYKDFYGTPHVLGYTLPGQPDIRAVVPFHPLSRFNGTAGFDSITIFPANSAPIGTDPINPILVTTFPTNVTTLSDAAKAIPGNQIAVDAAVADEPVTIAGIGNAPASQWAQALADVYGLYLKSGHGGSSLRWSITLLTVHPPANVDDLPSALRQTIPQPLRHAMHLQEAVESTNHLALLASTFDDVEHSAPSSQVSDGTGQEETPAELEKAMQQRDAILAYTPPSGQMPKFGIYYADQVSKSAVNIETNAVRLLNEKIGPQLEQNPNGIDISELGKKEHDLLATYFLAETASDLANILTQPMSPLLSHLNEIVLSGEIYGDPSWPLFRLSFSLPLPNGSKSFEAEIGGFRYDQ